MERTPALANYLGERETPFSNRTPRRRLPIQKNAEDLDSHQHDINHQEESS